jgi:hypothetical protein
MLKLSAMITANVRGQQACMLGLQHAIFQQQYILQTLQQLLATPKANVECRCPGSDKELQHVALHAGVLLQDDAVNWHQYAM